MSSNPALMSSARFTEYGMSCSACDYATVGEMGVFGGVRNLSFFQSIFGGVRKFIMLSWVEENNLCDWMIIAFIFVKTSVMVFVSRTSDDFQLQ